jgi:hypothetical protein
MSQETDVDIDSALRAVQTLGVGAQLTERIASLESLFRGQSMPDLAAQLAAQHIDEQVLQGARVIKDLAGQINVVIHVVGILLSLPHILAEGEIVESLSLGAGNTGRRHDLETDRQIDEFKFIVWRGGAEAIRQNGLFVDIFNLASAPGDKRRVMYVVDRTQPMRFLTHNRSLSSVLSKNRAVEDRFHQAHGNRYSKVSEYWNAVADRVEIVDLCDVVPAFAAN